MKRVGKVSEAFDIDEDVLFEKASESDYWQSCDSFYNKVKDQRAASLSEKQLAWLEKIETGLAEG